MAGGGGWVGRCYCNSAGSWPWAREREGRADLEEFAVSIKGKCRGTEVRQEEGGMWWDVNEQYPLSAWSPGALQAPFCPVWSSLSLPLADCHLSETGSFQRASPVRTVSSRPSIPSRCLLKPR